MARQIFTNLGCDLLAHLQLDMSAVYVHWELSLPLQERSICGNELVRLQSMVNSLSLHIILFEFEFRVPQRP